MKSLLLVAAILLGGSASVAAQAPLRLAYHIAFPDPASHLYDIALDIDGVTGNTLALQLPVWSPGRYARMDFAKNVQEFQATTANGRALQWKDTLVDGVAVYGLEQAKKLAFRSIASAPLMLRGSTYTGS